MGLYSRAVGVMAATNHVLGSIRLYHGRLNWLALASLVWVFVDGAGRPSEGTPGGLFGDQTTSAMATVALSACGLILFAVSIWQKNMIFRPKASWTRAVAPAVGRSEAGETIDLRATGRFRRGVGDALSLRDFPVAWEDSETGAVSLVTRVVDRGGLPELFSDSADRSETWSLVLSRESLTGDMEVGLLYFGLSAGPAMGLQVPGEPRAVILRLGHASELIPERVEVRRSSRGDCLTTTRGGRRDTGPRGGECCGRSARIHCSPTSST
jgi:hypothetical protein